jgi:hypothetical protein
MPTADPRRKRVASRVLTCAALVIGLLLVVGGTLILSPTLAQQVEDRLVNSLQIQGRWLGIFPIAFAPRPLATPLATPQHPTGPVSGPLRVHATNPRYFSDAHGKLVLLTGSHTWTNLQDAGDGDPPPVFDYDAFLDFLEAHHHNFFRLWHWEQARWGSWNGIDGFRFAPHPYPRPGPGLALDGKPKFDLSQFNQAYFDRMRARIIQAGERGFYVSVMLFDGWSIEDKGGWGTNPWQGHPFNLANNINGINGDPNNDGQGLELHSLTISTTLALQEAYIRKVIDTVGDLDNVLYEVSNESGAQSIEWQYHLINSIKRYEATQPKQHPVGMTGLWPWPENNRELANQALYDSPADWISPAGELYNRPVATGDKVILADTDHLCGICGDRIFAWSSFTRGENPIFMDVWNCAPWWYPNDCERPVWPSLRTNLGYIADYASRIDLAAMTPQPGLASTNFILANGVASGAEYLVYLPEGGTVTVDLSATVGELVVEWFDPASGHSQVADPVQGGTEHTFTAPFPNDTVLYLHQQASTTTNFQLFLPVVGSGVINAPRSLAAVTKLRRGFLEGMAGV